MKTVGDLMTVEVQTVGPEMKLPDLERALMDARVSGFPVLENRQLVGVVSRSDVVRKLAVEQSLAETISEFYVDLGAFEPPTDSLVRIGEQVGARIADMTVAEVMHHDPVTIEADASIAEAARILVARRIHRLPVVRDGELVGLVTSLDFVRLLAEEDPPPA